MTEKDLNIILFPHPKRDYYVDKSVINGQRAKNSFKINT